MGGWVLTCIAASTLIMRPSGPILRVNLTLFAYGLVVLSLFTNLTVLEALISLHL